MVRSGSLVWAYQFNQHDLFFLFHDSPYSSVSFFSGRVVGHRLFFNTHAVELDLQRCSRLRWG